jgi:hypothetical protein
MTNTASIANAAPLARPMVRAGNRRLRLRAGRRNHASLALAGPPAHFAGVILSKP